MSFVLTYHLYVAEFKLNCCCPDPVSAESKGTAVVDERLAESMLAGPALMYVNGSTAAFVPSPNWLKVEKLAAWPKFKANWYEGVYEGS